MAAISQAPLPAAPLIERNVVCRLLPGVDLWDYWPVQEMDGSVARIAGGSLMMLLSAPEQIDPNARHALARIRVMHHTATGWSDLGNLLPDGLCPGSREWAGSAVVSPDHARLTLYFTAAGVAGEAVPSFAQRLFECDASLSVDERRIVIGEWSAPRESVTADGEQYMREMKGGGGIGTIKAFRDPAFFRDPDDGQDYLLFAASLARSGSTWNGAVGLARRTADGSWALQPPLVDADGLNNELERPHVIVHGGRYYLFWSTQQKVFADGGPSGPNGLYGMVADRLMGPWLPINGTGLVLANPPEAPFQTFSWLVLADLTVLSFVDLVGIDRVPHDPVESRAHFGGVPAPIVRLRLDGDRSSLA